MLKKKEKKTRQSDNAVSARKKNRLSKAHRSNLGGKGPAR